MDAKAHDLDYILRQRQQWVVPVYQRHYAWESAKDGQIPKAWADLRDRAIERLESQTRFPHYFGAIIYSEPPKQPFGAIQKRFLVDGQQRITTFNLVIAALREVASKLGIEHTVNIAEAYLFNDEGKGMDDPERERYKLWPSAYDRQLFRQIMDNNLDEIRENHTPSFFYKNGNLKTGNSPKLLQSYWYFVTQIEQFIEQNTKECLKPEDILNALIDGLLAGFRIVVIQLDQHDDAHEIFASLNGMAKPLSPFDLIRNDVFCRARRLQEDDEKLFDDRWSEFEKPFWSAAVRQGRFKRARADYLVANTVICETARDVNVGKIAVEYQRYAYERGFKSVAEELDVLLTHGRTYQALERQEDASDLVGLSRVLQIWDLSTFHPLILWINAYEKDTEIRKCFYRQIEAYIIRRQLCALTTKGYNRVVTGLLRSMRGSDNCLNAFRKHLSGLEGSVSRMPRDDEVSKAVKEIDIYWRARSPQIRYILLQIESKLRTKLDESICSKSDLTIEHIMPRKWEDNWPLTDGKFVSCQASLYYNTQSSSLYSTKYSGRYIDVDTGDHIDDETALVVDKRNKIVDSLGNLTLLTGWLNPILSNSEWNKKKASFSESLLALNREIAKSDQWDENSISQRADKLCSVILDRWAYEP